jgi:transcriptional regulator with PAS, ATPase and Fis domain
MQSGKNVHDFVSKIQCDGKKVIPVKLNAAVLKNNQGESVGTVVSFRDISALEKRKADLQTSTHFHGVVGRSAGMTDVFSLITEISGSDVTVLIQGETGSGKEMIANAIQASSLRKKRPFIKVNCSVIPPHLLASELFGHAKGAFTDAVQDRIGRFETADKGTLFLDEISEMSLQMQAQLLRILQEGTFERLGESTTRKVDVRIIAASNMDIRLAVARGKFREDLMYRLNVIPITVPPLRSRSEDITFLVDFFIRKFAPLYNKNIAEIDADALELLVQHQWPGNVRELENAIEYAFVRSKKTISLCVCSLPPYLREDQKCSENVRGRNLRETVRNTDLIRLLIEHNWNKNEVARLLGINRSTVWRRMKGLGINK